MSTLFLALYASCSTLTLIPLATQNVVQGIQWIVYYYKQNRIERLCIGNMDQNRITEVSLVICDRTIFSTI